MVDFRYWAERVAAAFGIIPKRIRYSRKSTESLDRQVASHDQQSGAADEMWGPIDKMWVWKDNQSGTTFDRPAFQDMLAFCKAHPQRKDAPGRVEIYDPSRFGRCLDEDGKPDIMSFLAVSSQFQSYNWQIEFVTVRRTGEQLIDLIMMALYAYAAAVYSMNLSNSVRLGRIDHASKGWWTNGTAPWGTWRLDTQTGRLLKDGERSTPGGGGTILVPNPEILQHWVFAVKLILGGASLDRVGAALFEQGVRGPRGGALGHRSIRNFLTHPALIGEIEYRDDGEEGKREQKRTKANWEPMVDCDLFAEVVKRLDGHSRTEKPRRRRRRDLYPLTPTCAHCGAEYNGNRLSEKQGSRRGYTHAKPRARMHPEAHARFVEQGCRAWHIDAEEIETKIKNLIVQQRSSEEFEEIVRELILERDDFRKQADEAVVRAKDELSNQEAKYKRLSALIAAALDESDPDDSDDPMVQNVKAARQAIKAAKAKLADAESFAVSRENAWERLAGIIHETRNIAAVWEKAGPEERKVLLDYWVDDLMIVVEPIEGMRRANKKTALVSLCTAPNAPVDLELAGQSSISRSADSSALTTAPSTSKGKRRRKAAAASAPPIRPSAEAACDRTSTSGSSKAEASTGTSATAPALPSTTDELRFNPRSLACFMGEPLKAAENSGCDIDSNSTASDRASLPSSEALGANAASDSSFANLWLYGHTS